MKSIRYLCFLVVLLIMMICPASADERDQIIYDYPLQDITVAFEANTSFSTSTQQAIADSFAGIAMLDSGTYAPNNILCILFGHNTSVSTVTVTYHRVAAHEPRCRIELYDVEACSRCDYTVDTYITSNYIYCHPEDPMN